MNDHRTTLDLDLGAPRSCPACGWSGSTREAQDFYDEVIALRCPRCDARVGPTYSLPSHDEIRTGAAAGHPEAMKQLAEVRAVEERWGRVGQAELDDPALLPPIPGDQPFAVRWSLTERDGDTWVVLSVEGKEIASELAVWEGLKRFEVVAKLLRARYGERVTGLIPDEGNTVTYLIGDRLSWADGPERVNAAVFGTG